MTNVLDGVTAVLFDFDDTLAASSVADRRALEETLRQHAHFFPEVSPAALLARHDAILEEVRQEFFRSGTWAYPGERFARLLAATGGDAARGEAVGAAFAASRAAHLALYPGVLAFLDALRAQGYGLGIVTNGPAVTQRVALERVGVAARVDVLAIAGEIGVRKPEPRFFEWARERLDRAPGEVLVVGDSVPLDVRPTRALGMRAVFVAGAPGDARSHLFDNAEVPAPGEADLVVARVTDLAPFLARTPSSGRP